jgi:hypothetical protein
VQPNDLAEVIALCLVLEPRTLAEKGIFIWDREGRICRSGENRFFSITDREVRGITDGEVVIAGQRTRLTQVMAFGDGWIQSNYLVPMAFMARELGLSSSGRRGRVSTDDGCGCCLLL